jgi:hypothetical protein
MRAARLWIDEPVDDRERRDKDEESVLRAFAGERTLFFVLWMAMVGLVGFAFYLRGINHEVFDELLTADNSSCSVLGPMKS